MNNTPSIEMKDFAPPVSSILTPDALKPKPLGRVSACCCRLVEKIVNLVKKFFSWIAGCCGPKLKPLETKRLKELRDTPREIRDNQSLQAKTLVAALKPLAESQAINAINLSKKQIKETAEQLIGDVAKKAGHDILPPLFSVWIINSIRYHSQKTPELPEGLTKPAYHALRQEEQKTALALANLLLGYDPSKGTVPQPPAPPVVEPVPVPAPEAAPAKETSYTDYAKSWFNKGYEYAAWIKEKVSPLVFATPIQKTPESPTLYLLPDQFDEILQKHIKPERLSHWKESLLPLTEEKLIALNKDMILDNSNTLPEAAVDTLLTTLTEASLKLSLPETTADAATLAKNLIQKLEEQYDPFHTLTKITIDHVFAKLEPLLKDLPTKWIDTSSTQLIEHFDALKTVEIAEALIRKENPSLSDVEVEQRKRLVFQQTKAYHPGALNQKALADKLENHLLEIQQWLLSDEEMNTILGKFFDEAKKNNPLIGSIGQYQHLLKLVVPPIVRASIKAKAAPALAQVIKAAAAPTKLHEMMNTSILPAVEGTLTTALIAQTAYIHRKEISQRLAKGSSWDDIVIKALQKFFKENQMDCTFCEQDVALAVKDLSEELAKAVLTLDPAHQKNPKAIKKIFKLWFETPQTIEPTKEHKKQLSGLIHAALDRFIESNWIIPFGEAIAHPWVVNMAGKLASPLYHGNGFIFQNLTTLALAPASPVSKSTLNQVDELRKHSQNLGKLVYGMIIQQTKTLPAAGLVGFVAKGILHGKVKNPEQDLNWIAEGILQLVDEASQDEMMNLSALLHITDALFIDLKTSAKKQPIPPPSPGSMWTHPGIGTEESCPPLSSLKFAGGFED